MSATTVDYRETLVTYLRSETPEEAAKTLGITKAGLTYRIETMRKAGVHVPKKKTKVFTSLFVAQLNSLVKKHS